VDTVSKTQKTTGKGPVRTDVRWRPSRQNRQAKKHTKTQAGRTRIWTGGSIKIDWFCAWELEIGVTTQEKCGTVEG